MNFRGLFPPGRELVTSFDWIDLASGAGYVILDGFNAIDSTGNNYILLDSSKASSMVGVAQDSVTTTGELFSVITSDGGTSMDIDFDSTPFQTARTIEGTGYVTATIAYSDAATLGGTVLTAKLRKWDGTTETEVVSVTSATKSIADGTRKTYTLQLDISKTNFKKGERIRLTMQVATTTSGKIYKFGHDPADNGYSDFEVGNSRLVLTLPLKLEV